MYVSNLWQNILILLIIGYKEQSLDYENRRQL